MSNFENESKPIKNNLKISDKFNERVMKEYVMLKEPHSERRKRKHAPSLINSTTLFVVSFMFIVSISILLVNKLLLFAVGTAAFSLVLLAYFILTEHFLKK